MYIYGCVSVCKGVGRRVFFRNIDVFFANIYFGRIQQYFVLNDLHKINVVTRDMNGNILFTSNIQLMGINPCHIPKTIIYYSMFRVVSWMAYPQIYDFAILSIVWFLLLEIMLHMLYFYTSSLQIEIIMFTVVVETYTFCKQKAA